MSILSRTVSLVIIMAIGAAPGFGATTWYVDSSTGSDVTGDGSSGNPWASVTHVLAQAGVVDGDTLSLSGGFDENPVVTKEVTLSGGVFTFSASGGTVPNTYGLRIDADNVTINGVDFQNTAGTGFSGALLYASRAGTPISGLLVMNCNFDTTQNTGSPDTTVVCAVTELPRGCVFYNCYAMVDNGMGMSGPVADSGFLFLGGQPDGTQRNRILACHVNGMPVIGTTAGFGVKIMPGGAETAEAYDIVDAVLAPSLSQGILLDDSTGLTAAGGIRDITITESFGSGIYSNARNIEIVGAADGASDDISDIRIAGIQGLGFATDAGVMVWMNGGTTPNIDFGSIFVHNCNIDGNTGYAIRNWVSGQTLDARFNYFGNTVDPPNPSTGPADDAGVINGNGDQITTDVDASSWRPTSVLDTAFIGAPGGTATLNLVGSGNATVSMDLVSPETGFISAGLLDGPPNQGFFGMLNGLGLTRTMNIVSDVPNGNFMALIQIYYDGTFVPGDETDIILYAWDETGTIWRPAVEFNTAGTPQWLSDSIPPSLPLQPSDLGKYGVDTASNFAWAVVDHFTEFGVGEGTGGLGVPVELSVFGVD